MIYRVLSILIVVGIFLALFIGEWHDLGFWLAVLTWAFFGGLMALVWTACWLWDKGSR